MNTKESYDAAEDVAANLDSIKCLLSAVDDKVRFYLLEADEYGPYQEIVRYHAREIQGLLAIVDGIVADADKDLGGVVRTLHDLSREADCA